MKKQDFICCIIFLLTLINKGYSQNSELVNRVLVVKNANSAISVAVGNDYMERRGVKKFLNINCPDGAVSQDNESIDYSQYVATIETPLKAYLKDHAEIDFVVFTKGTPIRILNTPGKPYGGVCSVDSRVASLDYDKSPFSSMVHISDPDYGKEYVADAWINKFWNSETAFSHKNIGGYLVTRLDGYTQADAMALTTRSLEAEKKALSDINDSGPILLDACPNYGFFDKASQPYTLIPRDYTPGQTIYIIHESAYGEYNTDMNIGFDSLSLKKIPVLYDSTDYFVGNKFALMGYISWGSNDTHYDQSAYNSLTFSVGALAETAVSTSARTFLPTSGGQSLITDLIAQGVTGVKGYTDEPLLQGIASPSILFSRYTRGWTLAESFYAASRVVGWMDIVIGDPICSPYRKKILIPVTESEIILFPNPTSNIVYLNTDGDYPYKIYTTNGVVVSAGRLINKQIDIHKLKAGLYIVSIWKGNTVIHKKLIKQDVLN
jgi:hypothetical protein